jgi:hypothetical protein
MAVAASAGGVIPGDETTLLIVLAILWAIAVGIGAFVTQSGTTAARNTVFAKPGARPLVLLPDVCRLSGVQIAHTASWLRDEEAGRAYMP